METSLRRTQTSYRTITYAVQSFDSEVTQLRLKAGVAVKFAVKCTVKFVKIKGIFFAALLVLLGQLSYAQPSYLEQNFLQKLTVFEPGEHRERYGFEVKEVPEFSAHSVLKYTLHETSIIFRLEYDHQAISRPELFIPDALFLWFIRRFGPTPIAGLIPQSNTLLKKLGSQVTAYSIAELMENAHAGNIAAQVRLLRWKAAIIDGLKVSNEFEAQFPGVRAAIEQRFNEMNQQIADLKPRIIPKVAPWFDVQRLKELVVQNNRAGVGALLRAGIHWETLQPIEAQTWESWIEAIERPTLDKAVWLFRGFQNPERFHQAAISQSGNIAFVSPQIVPNIQQNDIEHAALADSSAELVSKVTDTMHAHSEAFGGPSIFMSFSSDFDVAEGFVSGGDRFSGPPGELLAVRIDRRRAFPNIVSSFTREREYLAALLIFPDEVMHLAKNYTGKNRQDFLTAIQAKGYRHLPDEELAKNFWKDSAEILNSLQKDLSHRAAKCDKIFL